MYKISFILFLLLMNSIQTTSDSYYSSCASGAPKSGLLTYSECQKYSYNETRCCLLYYVTYYSKDLNTYKYKNKIAESNSENKGRKLAERKNTCFGITKEGYDNIKDVIEEIEEENDIDDIHIDCSEMNLIFSSIFIILLLILLF